ncbi:hypothetical protein HHI36_016570 [Cryptolaemus montrouzieri]|uniref:AB hydrolase-1 domain-containing protein n=1 Tax=Cryptolaemus montrouzieri TaxID=559131 RepID=A0ABD2NKH7_9CUCU
MHRIPYGRNGSSENRRVILLVHGLLNQAEHFLIAGMYNGSLAYLLADNEFDVWLANCRGTNHSRQHISLSSEDPMFWNFSWHEIGKYDLPAKIDYILEKTKKRKIFYAGYSQGGTSFYVMCTERPEYQDKIILASLMAPSAFFPETKKIPLANFFSTNHEEIMELVDDYSLYCFPSIKYSLGEVLMSLCVDSLFDNQCYIFLLETTGAKPENINPYMLPLWFRFSPKVAAKQIVHYLQLIYSGTFRKFDYGTTKNLQIYGQSKPPDYPVGNITAPIAFYSSLGDFMAEYSDIQQMCSRILSCERSFLLRSKHFSHFDFILSNKVEKKLNVPMLRFMQRYDEDGTTKIKNKLVE